jgi:hypothetical protein
MDGQLDVETPVSVDPARRAGGSLATGKIALGEELPIFCERCGYALHGMPQHVCPQCTVRQFHCPECGHHQPINTLRPAFQKTLGRVRAFFLVISLLIKLNFFGWLLFAWVIAGYENSYQYQDQAAYSSRVATAAPNGGVYVSRGGVRSTYAPAEYDMEAVVGLSLFALTFGMVGRMLLLRWRRGYLVGLTLAALVCTMFVIGAYWNRYTRGDDNFPLPSPLTGEFLGLLATLAVTLTLGASIVWGLWVTIAHLFLPRRTSQALLDWQRSLSNPPAAELARD